MSAKGWKEFLSSKNKNGQNYSKAKGTLTVSE
jgi:hypothetical protein